MGKGFRNRDERISDNSVLTKPKKPRKQKRGHTPLPKWLMPVVISVVAVGVLLAIIFSSLINNAVFKRNNVLISGQEAKGKYSINEITGKLLLWYSGWVSGQNEYYSSINWDSTTYSQNDETSYSLYYAQAFINDMGKMDEERAHWLEELTALCDYGVKNNITFTAEDEDSAYTSILSSFHSQAKNFYQYANEVGLSNGGETLVKYPYNYSSYVDNANYPYFYEFITQIFGNGIKEADMRRAGIIISYAGRVRTIINDQYWNPNSSEVNAELKENPDLYYSSAYLLSSTEDSQLAEKLKAATDETEFKKILVADYVEKNYAAEYNEELAEKLQEALTEKTDAEIATALETNGLTATEYEKPQDSAETELTQDQIDWLFNSARAKNDVTVISSKGTSTVLFISDIVTKDEAGNITKVSAVMKTFDETFDEEKLGKLINEVYYQLKLLDETDETAAEEMRELIDALQTDISLPSEKTSYYVKAVDVDKEVGDLKDALDQKETADEKTAYLSEQNVPQKMGIPSTSEEIDDEIKAVLFPEEGTAQVGVPQIIETDGGSTKHLIYVTEVGTTGEGEAQTATVTYYDFSSSKYQSELQKWLSEGVDEETMTGSPAVGAIYSTTRTETETETETVYYDTYIVTRSMDLGEQVIRGGFATFANEDQARNANEKLRGLTGAELLNKLSELGENTITSDNYTVTKSLAENNSKDVMEWLFDDARVANDAKLILPEDSEQNVTGYYIAVFLNKVEAGRFSACNTYASAQTSADARKLAEDGNYKISEKALAKIK